MSPVSRGRKSKKAKNKGRKRPGRAPGSGRVNAADLGLSGLSFAEPASPLDALFGSRHEPEWWRPAHERVIDASGRLLALRGPRELEQATAELIGAELYDAVREKRSGLRFDLWATELIGRAVDRIAEAAGGGDDAWQGPWRLLHGLACIGSYGLGAFAWEQASKAAKSVPRDALAAQPAWLKLMPDIKATGDVQVMRDAYGTRFGVIAGFCYPGGVDPSVYVFDIDACGFIGLAGAGVFDGVAQAAAAWREQVGVSAEGLVPVPATAGSLTCLVYCEHEEAPIMGGESRALMDNWFRGPRRMHDVHGALREQGVVLPPFRSLYHDIDTAPMAAAFAVWYAENRDLQEEIAARGLVLSQFWPDAPPQKQNFLMRNATMSGYGLATVVVEAGEHSGARSQARMAVEHGRQVILTEQVVVRNDWARSMIGRPGVYVGSSVDSVLQVVEQLRAMHEELQRLVTT